MSDELPRANIQTLTDAGSKIREHVDTRWAEMADSGIPPERRVRRLLVEVSEMDLPNILTHEVYELTGSNRKVIEHIMQQFKQPTDMLWWNARRGVGYWRWIGDRKRHVDKMSKRRQRERKRNQRDT